METRIQSIDAFRALTMFLMVWVNDFWTLSEVPAWLLHVSADTDGMGFSDVIFPAFLFIVGLSIPFALRARKEKGENAVKIVIHILKRSASLLLMGILIVNLDSYSEEAALISKTLWQVLMVLAFFLIWNRYPRGENWTKRAPISQGLGWCLIAFLVLAFRSDPGNGYNGIEVHWWGILGLIGWCYLICSLLVLGIGERVYVTLVAWLLLVVFNIAVFAGWLGFLDSIRPYVWIVGDASLPALTMAGCVVSLLVVRFSRDKDLRRFCLLLVGAGLACIVVGFLLRPLAGISKIHSTPSWTQICTGIGLLSFALIFWLVDVKKRRGWMQGLAPAGAATLTCYLLPYLVYPFLYAFEWELPGVLTTGVIGLHKSLLFAYLVVFATGLANRVGIKLGV